MSEYYHGTDIEIPSHFYNKPFNVDGEEVNGNKLSPENELTEYLIQFRADDLLDVINTFEFELKLDEYPLIQIILTDNRDMFRNILRDAVTMATILVNHNRNDMVNISLQSRRLRNNIKINLHSDINIKLNELNASDYEGEIITFEAQVSYWSRKRTITHFAEYKCPECEYVQSRPFKGKIIKDKCPDDNIPLEFYKPTISEDTRRISLRELSNDFSDGKVPMSISADVYGKTVWEIELSDKVVVTGVFRSIPLRLENGKISQEFIPTIQVISIQNMKTDKIEMPSMELMKRFKDLEVEGKLQDAVIDGFAYNIYKKRMEKKAILCSLMGSEWIGQVGKGNPPMIHILFVGDPDTYKSTIMKYIINVSDNCVLADSTTVSNAGIKAIAVKMDDGRMSIMAGLLPTHSGGVMFLDEFGDLSPSIYADLKAPMIDGRVSKHVAGEDFEGKAETGVLASMNPTDGVYDDNKNVLENLAVLKKPLITRFDLIVKFSIDFNNLYDKEIGEHFDKCDFEGKPKSFLKDEEIKLFINYAKTLHPTVSREALKRNTEFFAEIKAKSKDKKSVETRTKNAIMKFATALAKWHMCNEVLVEHVNEALELYKEALLTFNMHFEDGEFINESSLKKTEDGRRTAMYKAYDKLKDENGYVFEDEVIDEALTYGCFNSRGLAKALINTMRMETKVSEKDKMLKFTR